MRQASQVDITYHVTVASGNTKAGHSPEQRVKGARLLGEEVPCRVMSSGGLGDLTVWTWFHSVNQVGKADSILAVCLLVIAGDDEMTASGFESRSLTQDGQSRSFLICLGA
jgi:hypothetical protein